MGGGGVGGQGRVVEEQGMEITVLEQQQKKIKIYVVLRKKKWTFSFSIPSN